MTVYHAIYCRNCLMSHAVGWRVPCNAQVWDKTAEAHYNGDNLIQNFNLGRYIVGYTFGNTFYGDAQKKLNFRPYIRQYSSPNGNFEYSYPLILQFKIFVHLDLWYMQKKYYLHIEYHFILLLQFPWRWQYLWGSIWTTGTVWRPTTGRKQWQICLFR